MNRKDLTRHIQEINADRITEMMRALEECGEGGPMIAALKEQIAAVQQPRSELVDQAERLMGSNQLRRSRSIVVAAFS